MATDGGDLGGGGALRMEQDYFSGEKTNSMLGKNSVIATRELMIRMVTVN